MSDPQQPIPPGLTTGKPAAAPEIPGQLPILPLSDVVVFPYMIAPLLVASQNSIRLIDDVVAGDRLIGVTLQKNPEDEHPHLDQLQMTGCIVRVVRMIKLPDESARVLIQGLKRMRITDLVNEQPYLVAKITPLEDEVRTGIELTALQRNAGNQFQQIVSLTPTLPDELKVTVLNIDEPSKLADVIAASLNFSLGEKQRLLELTDVRLRLNGLAALLTRELEVLHLGSEIQSKVSSALNKSQREYFLREHQYNYRSKRRHAPAGSGELSYKADRRSCVYVYSS